MADQDTIYNHNHHYEPDQLNRDEKIRQVSLTQAINVCKVTRYSSYEETEELDKRIKTLTGIYEKYIRTGEF